MSDIKITARRCEKGVQQESAKDNKAKHQVMDHFYSGNAAPPRIGGIVAAQQQQQQQHELESPDHTQRDTNESDNNISSCSTLDIGKVEHLSVHQLETQVRELNQRLQQAEQQRVKMQRQLDDCVGEKEHCLRRLEVVSAAHECRITEMHCVIAELSKKLRAKQESTILEEQEPEGSEISYQDGSVYNSEMNLTNPDAECQTDPLDGCGGAENSAAEDCGNLDTASAIDILATEELNLLNLSDNAAANKGQVEALQEEVLHLKGQIALLQSELANSLRLDVPLADNKKHADIIEERQSYEFYDDDAEANESNCCTEQRKHYVAAARGSAREKLNNLNLSMSTQPGLLTPLNSIAASPQRDAPVPKMAERVRLRCASKPTHNAEGDNNNTATDLHDMKSAEIVDHIVAELKHNSDNSLLESCVEANELQRLQRKVEHLKAGNIVLSLTLDECKEHCEHLYLLCGKYESNAIALQTAVNCSDRAIEAYDVMLALLESKLALLKESTAAADDSRKAVESVARHLLDRFESEKNICENSLGPWQNTFNIPEKASAPWTSDNDLRLRYHVSKLKGRRSTVQNTIVNLESPFSDMYEKSRLALEASGEKQCREKSGQLDLEAAVVMQELLTLREENINMKCRIDDAGRERQYAVEKAGVLQEALQQLQVQYTSDAATVPSSSQLSFQRNQLASENRVSYSEAEHAALTEQQLVEALGREWALKGRIQMLIASVAATEKMSDDKYEQLHGNIRELQKSNLSLTQMLEHNKRKYQTRIRKLEQKLADQCYMAGRVGGGGGGAGAGGALHQQGRLKCAAAYKADGGSPLHDAGDVPETTL